jgi:hypothetical protein
MREEIQKAAVQKYGGEYQQAFLVQAFEEVKEGAEKKAPDAMLIRPLQLRGMPEFQESVRLGLIEPVEAVFPLLTWNTVCQRRSNNCRRPLPGMAPEIPI